MNFNAIKTKNIPFTHLTRMQKTQPSTPLDARRRPGDTAGSPKPAAVYLKPDAVWEPMPTQA